VKAAAGTDVDLTKDEFDAVRLRAQDRQSEYSRRAVLAGSVVALAGIGLAADIDHLDDALVIPRARLHLLLLAKPGVLVTCAGSLSASSMLTRVSGVTPRVPRHRSRTWRVTDTLAASRGR
jgi:hypothetical protein